MSDYLSSQFQEKPPSYKLYNILTLCFTVKGRVSRRTFLIANILLLVVALIIVGFSGGFSAIKTMYELVDPGTFSEYENMLFPSTPGAVSNNPLRADTSLMSMNFTTLVVVMMYLVASSCLIIKRLHDLNWSGWWCLATSIPFLNLGLLLLLFGLRGTPGSNLYGAPE